MAEKANFDDHVRHIYEEAAGSLASDRQTRTLPVVMAELFFIEGWIVSLIKAAASEPGATNWVNVEAQSIAISALYLWVTSTVVIASLIGASQTENSIPRILHGVESQLAAFQNKDARWPSMVERIEISWCERTIDRAADGGTYSWKSLKWKNRHATLGIGRRTVTSCSSVATTFVACSFFFSATLSHLVSPREFNCRHIPEALVYVMTLASVSTVAD